MKYAAASDTVIYKKKSDGKYLERRGKDSLTAIHRKIKASMENVNDAASQADMRKMRK